MAHREEILGHDRYERDRDALGRPANARPRDRYGRPLPRGAVDEMPGRDDPEQVVTSSAGAVERGIALFDEQRFFEAHEFFEYVWHAAAGTPDAEFWKGVTQVAVGFCHTQRGNRTGALTLLDRAAERLEAVPARHHGVDTARLAAAARDVAGQVAASGASPALAFPRFPRA